MSPKKKKNAYAPEILDQVEELQEKIKKIEERHGKDSATQKLLG